ncbi:stage II sporulation protein M [Compostibacter hankyongensis]|uniref:Stage II sporulation protein M n=1 Tax=Compostibacter hankyongensis TaxID=1007089 RepID=A0ABP8FF12_9BACT
MREAYFLKKNAGKWKQYESELGGKPDPDRLAEGFIELTDDLSYARTFYPASNTTRYLNGLAARFHQHIYRNRKERGGRFFSFWRYELPWMFYRHQRLLLYTFIIFAVFVFIGVLSALYDHQFIRAILGDGYVNMTLENIEKGDPFGVYAQTAPAGMFLKIALNNIFVAFVIYVCGITAGVFTVIFLMRNSIMLGAFVGFFFTKGLGADALLAVFIHGTLEISGLVVEACAGLIMARAILFPKTYSRKVALGSAAKDGLKVIMGMVPVILLAAFLESFVTRYYQTMPLMLNLFILAASLAFMGWYFIGYPRQLHKRMEKNKARDSPGGDQNFMVWMNKKLSSGK